MNISTPRYDGIMKTTRGLRDRLEAARAAHKAAAESADVDSVVRIGAEIAGIENVLRTLDGEAVAARFTDLEDALAAAVAARQKIGAEYAAKISVAAEAKRHEEELRAAKEDTVFSAAIMHPAVIENEMQPTAAKWVDIAKAYTAWAKAQDIFEEVRSRMYDCTHAENIIRAELADAEKALHFAAPAVSEARDAAQRQPWERVNSARPVPADAFTALRRRMERWLPNAAAELEAE